MHIPLLVGENLDKELLANLAKEADSNSHQQFCLYLAEEIGADQLLANVSDSHLTNYAHFTIGMRYLSKGDRANAKIHFAKTQEAFLPGRFGCHWSRAFLELLEDNSWPERNQCDERP